MKKIIEWVLNKKIGTYIVAAQTFLSGKKTHLLGIGIAVPALMTILGTFSDQGLPYLLDITTKPEYKQMMEGFAMITLRTGITKLKGGAQ